MSIISNNAVYCEPIEIYQAKGSIFPQENHKSWYSIGTIYQVALDYLGQSIKRAFFHLATKALNCFSPLNSGKRSQHNFSPNSKTYKKLTDSNSYFITKGSFINDVTQIWFFLTPNLVLLGTLSLSRMYIPRMALIPNLH